MLLKSSTNDNYYVQLPVVGREIKKVRINSVVLLILKMLSWYFQLLAVIEHYNIRIQKYFLIPIILVTACTATYNSTVNDTISLLLLLNGLMYAFELGTSNASYRNINSNLRVVKTAPYIIFILSNIGKVICSCLLLIDYNPNNWIFVFVNGAVLTQTILTFVCMGFLTCLSCDTDLVIEYQHCRRQMESIVTSPYDQINS